MNGDGATWYQYASAPASINLLCQTDTCRRPLDGPDVVFAEHNGHATPDGSPSSSTQLTGYRPGRHARVTPRLRGHPVAATSRPRGSNWRTLGSPLFAGRSTNGEPVVNAAISAHPDLAATAGPVLAADCARLRRCTRSHRDRTAGRNNRQSARARFPPPVPSDGATRTRDSRPAESTNAFS